MLPSVHRRSRAVALLLPLVLLLSAAGNAVARDAPGEPATFAVADQGVSSLEGSWRVMAGDDPAYAAPDYDDRSWPLAAVPGNLMERYPGHRGVAWYRARLVLRTAGVRIMALGKICDADEVYVNGRLIGGTGRIDDPASHAFDRDRWYVVPDSALRVGVNTVAVRTRGYLDDAAGMIWGTYRIGPPAAMLAPIIATYADDVFFIGIYLFIAVYFMIFSFMKGPLSGQQRLLAAMSLCFAVYLFCQGPLKYLLTDHFFYFHLLQYFAGMGGTASFLMLFRMMFSQKPTRIDQAALGLLAVSAAAIAVLPDIRLWTVPRIAWHLVIFYAAVVVVRNLVRSIMQRNGSRVYLYIGFGIILVTAILEVLRTYSLLGDISFLRVGLVGLIVNLSFYLADQYVIIQRIEHAMREHLEVMVVERTRELGDRNRTIEDQLEVARLIQAKLIPAQPPSVSGLSMHSVYVPMDKIGGDFYDYREAGQRVRFFIADVSGHGVPGAFLALIAKMSFQQAQDGNHDEAATLQFMNGALCQSAVMSSFVTAFLVTLDMEGQRLTYASAGHHPALVLGRDRGDWRELHTRGIPLGWQADARYSADECPLAPGDRIVLYTDGIVEAVAPDGAMFGMDRFREYLLSVRGESPEACARGLLERVMRFTDGQVDDDITAVIIDAP